MFKWKFDQVFLFAIQSKDGGLLPIVEWEQEKSYTAHKAILDELAENGFAEVKETCYEVHPEDIYQLADFERQVLELPDFYPYEIYVQADGMLNQATFKYKYGFYDFAPNGNRFKASRKGPVISFDSRTYLLQKPQFLLCEAIDKFNSLVEKDKTFQNNLLNFSDIKDLTSQEAAILDNYLQNETVYKPERIKVDLSRNGDLVNVEPGFDEVEDESFQKAFDLFPSTREVYNAKDNNGNKMRVVLDPKQKEQLDVIKKNFRRVNVGDEEKVRELIENPQLYFDEDLVDVSAFYSDRVIEIGLYKPSFYSFVSPYRTQWIPGIGVESKVHGTKKIFFKDEQELADFEQETERAKQEGREVVVWNDTGIPVLEAEPFLEVARRQFQNQNAPVRLEDLPEGQGGREKKVLIIEENADWLGYQEHEEGLDAALEHNFYKVDNLSPAITPKGHQTEGVAWLQNLYNKKVRGCLLADDMGLGKTLQLLYFIEWIAQTSSKDKPVLVVAPVSLLENWTNEYSKFFDPQTLPLLQLYRNIPFGKSFNSDAVKKLQQKQLILTNYETLRSYQLVFGAVDFALIVLDEAQKIKTPGTQVTNAAKALKADFKVAMTGTPVENTLLDLWCIMDFTTPGLLGNAKDFAGKYQHPLQSEDTDLQALGEELRREIGVLIKRRLKQDVATDLPKKLIERLEVQMPPEQLDRYMDEIQFIQEEGADGIKVLTYLQKVRDISDHPYLADNQITSYSSEELVATSAKLQATTKIIAQVKELDEKAIIFADRRETQRMLQQVMQDLFGMNASIINGDTPSSGTGKNRAKLSRQQTINLFQEKKGFNVIIMSPLAAGVGLNVTGANHVIHYSRHWNPAKEEQATDRAYRIGQVKDVYVYYPMAVTPEFDSFDIILDKLLNNKKALASSTLFPTEQAEVRPWDISELVFSTNVTSSNKPYSFEQISRLTQPMFEAYVAAVYRKKGYEVVLTPLINDKGADILAFGEDADYLILVKQSNNPIDVGDIEEIDQAKDYYESRYKRAFHLVLFTIKKLSNVTIERAQEKNIEIFGMAEMADLVEAYPISRKELYQQDKLRIPMI